MDFVGALPRSARGYRFLLVIMDYDTRYPIAVPLRGMQVVGVARAVLQIFALVGILKEILMDKRTSITSNLMKLMCKMLCIKQLFTTIYHPQVDRLVEQMNQTLKSLLRKAPDAFPCQ